MKRKRKLEMAGLLCMMPWMAFAQQVEPLTDPVRLFEDGKTLFQRHDYAAAQQTLTQYLQQEPYLPKKQLICWFALRMN